MKRLWIAIVAGTFLGSTTLFAQAPATAPPAAPQPQTATAAAAPKDPLPPANPKYFTAKSPSLDTVNSFLTQLWGYDSNRIWRVMAIQTTQAPNVTKVVVFITDKSPNAKVASATFYVTPDGKFAIAEGAGVVPFGVTPFADLGAMMRSRANGPARGAADKGLLIVEFADLECPHCKEAQATMDQIVKDFPKARVVFQLFPLADIHPSAFKAAAYGLCVQKQSGDEKFFKYVSDVFDTQDALSPTTDDTVLKAAVTRAGGDAAAAATCSETQPIKDAVNADIKFAEDAGVDQTPLLSVNGRLLPVMELPYEQLKQIIVYQAKLDGVETGAAPDILTPKPEAPKLGDVPTKP